METFFDLAKLTSICSSPRMKIFDTSRIWLDAASLASSLVHAIDQPFSLELYDLMVTLSVGIAIYPHDGKTSGS